MTDSEANGVEAPSELENKIIRQVEYYFGDINLAKDKFMQGETKKDEGWISLETMLNFNRLKALSADVAVIVKALGKSTSGLMEISEDQNKIRRNPVKVIPQFTKERKDDLKNRTLYIKGFPTDKTLDDLVEFLEKAGKVEHIQMRRNQEREFKGSVFAVFESEDGAKNFLESEDFKTYEDTELVRLKKDDYFKQKNDEKKKQKEEDFTHSEEQKKQREEEDKNKLLEKITKGAVFHVKGLPTGLNREELKKSYDKYSKVAWVDFDTGDTEAKVRFEEENAASSAIEKMKTEHNGKFLFNETEVEIRLLEGEEELQHWRERFRAMRDRRDFKRNKRNQGRSFGKRGNRKHFGGKKRGSTNDDDDGSGSGGEEMEKDEDKAVKRSHDDKEETDEPTAKLVKAD